MITITIEITEPAAEEDAAWAVGKFLAYPQVGVTAGDLHHATGRITQFTRS